MGTSINRASPKTLNWQAAQAAYRAEIPIERVVQEMWRAATNQPEGNIASLLAQPIVARVGVVAASGGTATEVAAAVAREIATSKGASLAADIASRAAVQCATATNRAQAFSERVFSEASNYLLSRDLPGYVGGANRNKTVADSLAFKSSVLAFAANAARDAGPPTLSSAQAWRHHVGAVVDLLARRRG